MSFGPQLDEESARHRRGDVNRLAVVGLLVLALCLSACFETWTRSRRESGSALWLGPASSALNEHQVGLLEGVGLGEFFVEAAALQWQDGEAYLEPIPPNLPPGRSVVALVVSGEWPSRELDAKGVAEGLADRLRQLKIDAESRGALPSGFHFDVAADRRLKSYGAVLGELRKTLDRDLLLSATVDVRWLDDPDLRTVSEPLHFFSTFLYGQQLNAHEDSRYWDLDRLVADAQRLDALDRDFLAGVVLQGQLVHLDKGGDRLAATPEAALQPLLDSAALEAKNAFLFKGFHRKLFDFEVKRPVRVGEWKLSRGHRLRLSQVTAYHLAQLHTRLEGAGLENHIGELYHRLRGPGESLSISLDELLASRAGGLPEPNVSFGLDLLRRRGSTWVVRASLRNRGSAGTSMALIDNNYLQLHVPGGGTFSRVDLGAFKRLEFSRPGDRRQTMDAVRRASTVRLFYPLLEDGWSVQSGEIAIRGAEETLELELSASFLLPDGRTYEAKRFWTSVQETEEPDPALESEGPG